MWRYSIGSNARCNSGMSASWSIPGFQLADCNGTAENLNFYKVVTLSVSGFTFAPQFVALGPRDIAEVIFLQMLSQRAHPWLAAAIQRPLVTLHPSDDRNVAGAVGLLLEPCSISYRRSSCSGYRISGARSTIGRSPQRFNVNRPSSYCRLSSPSVAPWHRVADRMAVSHSPCSQLGVVKRIFVGRNRRQVVGTWQPDPLRLWVCCRSRPRTMDSSAKPASTIHLADTCRLLRVIPPAFTRSNPSASKTAWQSRNPTAVASAMALRCSISRWARRSSYVGMIYHLSFDLCFVKSIEHQDRRCVRLIRNHPSTR